MLRTACVLMILLAVPLASAGAKEKPRGKPPAKDVAGAIRRGADWLRTRHAKAFETETLHSVPELVVLTLHHAGVDRKDKVLQAGVQTILGCPLQYTYRVATMAMALSRLNPYVHRARLAHCAQWLVETQLPDGSWGYPGTMVGRSRDTKALDVKPPVTLEEAKGGPKAEPIVIERKLPVERLAGMGGDISNTQFALLGLRACRDARIEIPKATWEAAHAWTVKHQQPDGSWGYDRAGERDEAGYASMTAACACGIAICRHGMKKSPKSDPAIKKAAAWLKKHWKPDDNAEIEDSVIIPPSNWHCYHLYSVERAARVLGWKKIGKRDWYAEGAWWLLDNQQSDGSWNDTRGDTTSRRPPYLQTADTCFAILFLSLATPPLTGG